MPGTFGIVTPGGRAARTGESYSTARRHVLARAGHSGYRTFGGGQHHESTLLAHLLDQALRGFLDEAADALGKPDLTRAATLFRASGAIWSAIATTARHGADTAVLGELADAVDQARIIEQQAAQIMTDAAA